MNLYSTEEKVEPEPWFKQLKKYLVEIKETATTIIAGALVIPDFIICDDNYIGQLNLQYRNKNQSTDVLTFIYPATANTDSATAEVYISYQTAKVQAQMHQVEFIQELCLLSVHGLLHANNFDHEQGEVQAEQMRELEQKILNGLNLRPTPALTQV